MKITRRSDKGKGGHLLVSVPANRLEEVEAALNYLEGQRQQTGSKVILELIIRAAKRNGWTEATTMRRPNEAKPADGTLAADHVTGGYRELAHGQE